MTEETTHGPRADAHAALTNWQGCECMIERHAGQLTRLYRFAGMKPHVQAAIWETETVAKLKADDDTRIVEIIESQHTGRDGLPTIRVPHDPGAQSLHTRLTEQLPELTLLQKCTVLRDVLSALAYLHRNGLVHRGLDLKAVLVYDDGCARLTNFASIAKFDAAGQATPPQAAPLKFPYATGAATLSVRHDLHALGFIAYQLLTWTYRSYSGVETMDAAISQLNSGLEGADLPRELINFVIGLVGRGSTPIPDANRGLEVLAAATPKPAPEPEPNTPPNKPRRPRLLVWSVVLGLPAMAATLAVPTVREKVHVYTRNRPSLPEPKLWRAETEELIGWTSGMCRQLPPEKAVPCDKNTDDFFWQKEADSEHIQCQIAQENCKTLGTEQPVMVIVYFGIWTGLPSDSYSSVFDQLRGILQVQKQANARSHRDDPKIQILIANGGLDQAHAKEVLKQLLEAKVPVAAVMGFADSRKGTGEAIEEACKNDIVAVTPTLSADQLTKFPCVVSMVSTNVVEAKTFHGYALTRGIKSASVFTTIGPGSGKDAEDLYVQSLSEDACKEFEDCRIIPFQVASDINQGRCPVGDHMVVFSGRHTDYKKFVRALHEICKEHFDPDNIVADDSASRVTLDSPNDEDVDPWIRKIPVVVKSPEITKDEADRFCPQPLTDCPSLLKGNMNVVARDSLLSATALELVLRSARNLVTNSNVPIEPHALQEQFKADMRRGVGQESHALLDSAADWKQMTANHPRKFFEDGTHLSPLYSPFTLVRRESPGHDVYLFGCAYLDDKTKQLTCKALAQENPTP